MLREIGDEDLQSAIATIKEDIALPAVLGRVCPKPCEKGCRRSGADGPVEVCELKRHVADLDLASGNPYRPPCRPDSGKRVAVVGAGPTGLAATFHLRQQGHAVTLIDAAAVPGGRLRDEFSEEQLPRETLDGEIGVILSQDVEFQPDTRLGDAVTLDELSERFDAVLLACGATDKTQIEKWGLQASSRGITVAKGTFETNSPGVFSAGNALRGRGLVVRSVADGKEAAEAIGQYLEGKTIVPLGRPFSSRVGKLQEGEMEEFLAGANDSPRLDGDGSHPQTLSLPIVSQQAHRCLSCGCIAQGNCKLEQYAIAYGADPGKYQSGRRAFVRVNRGGSVIYEPGKCINCELCIKIAAESDNALGLTFVGRGFDVRVGVPFDGTMEEALGDVAARCIAACPTGALYFSPMHTPDSVERQWSV